MLWDLMRHRISQIISVSALLWFGWLCIPLKSCLAQPGTKILPTNLVVTESVDAWCAPAASLPFPKSPASGKLDGQDFLVDSAGFDLNNNHQLVLRQGKHFFADREVNIWLKNNHEDYEGKTIVVVPSSDMFHSLTVIMSRCLTGKAPDSKMFTKGYGMRLQFGKKQGNILPGWILLRLPDADKSYVQGYFYAKLDLTPPGAVRTRLPGGKYGWKHYE